MGSARPRKGKEELRERPQRVSCTTQNTCDMWYPLYPEVHNRYGIIKKTQKEMKLRSKGLGNEREDKGRKEACKIKIHSTQDRDCSP